jgi:opacity protein-like surface antigen
VRGVVAFARPGSGLTATLTAGAILDTQAVSYIPTCQTSMNTLSRLSSWIPVLLLAGPSAALAQNRAFITEDAGPYLKFELGPTFAEDGEVTKFSGGGAGSRIDYYTGFDFDAAIGFAFNKYISTEFEFGWNGNEVHSAQFLAEEDSFLYSVPFLANLVLQAPLPLGRGNLVPYIGAGAGGSTTIFDTDGFSNGAITLVGSSSDVVFTYQAFAGVRYDINEQMSAGLGYKYFAGEDSTFEYEGLFGDPDVDLGISGVRAHMVLFQFNWRF